MAAAVTMLCRAVLAEPRQRARRRPKPRTPCEIVPYRAFDALPLVVKPPACLGLEPRLGRCHGLVLVARQEAEASALRAGAARARGAGPAVRGAEPGTDIGLARRLVGVLPPADADVALRTAHASPLPVHREVGGVEGVLSPRLPAQVRTRRPYEFDAVTLAGRDDVGAADIGAVDEMLGGARSLLARASWIASVRIASCTLAGTASACTIRRGLSGSQVSVRWTMVPVQPVPLLERLRASGS